MLFFVDFHANTEGDTARARIALDKDINFHGANSLLELSISSSVTKMDYLGLID